jgi:hypothetical protein
MREEFLICLQVEPIAVSSESIQRAAPGSHSHWGGAPDEQRTGAAGGSTNPPLIVIAAQTSIRTGRIHLVTNLGVWDIGASFGRFRSRASDDHANIGIAIV